MLAEKKARLRAEPAVLERLRTVVAMIGSQAVAAKITDVPYATLQRMLAGKSPLDHDRLSAIASAAKVSVDYILCRTDDMHGSAQVDLGEATLEEFVSVQRITALASAGNGVIADQEALEDSPFRLARSWLYSKFGVVNSLRAVLVNGASQEPDLHDGDWVLIDEARNALEDGLAVVRLDDGLLVKRLQRDGHKLHLVSRNPEYQTTTVDLRKDEDRIKVIGRVVYSFKSV